MQPGRRFDRRAVRTRAIHERGKPASARSSPSKAIVTFGLSANNSYRNGRERAGALEQDGDDLRAKRAATSPTSSRLTTIDSGQG